MLKITLSFRKFSIRTIFNMNCLNKHLRFVLRTWRAFAQQIIDTAHAECAASCATG